MCLWVRDDDVTYRSIRHIHTTTCRGMGGFTAESLSYGAALHNHPAIGYPNLTSLRQKYPCAAFEVSNYITAHVGHSIKLQV